MSMMASRREFVDFAYAALHETEAERAIAEMCALRSMPPAKPASDLLETAMKVERLEELVEKLSDHNRELHRQVDIDAKYIANTQSTLRAQSAFIQPLRGYVPLTQPALLRTSETIGRFNLCNDYIDARHEGRLGSAPWMKGN